MHTQCLLKKKLFCTTSGLERQPKIQWVVSSDNSLNVLYNLKSLFEHELIFTQAIFFLVFLLSLQCQMLEPYNPILHCYRHNKNLSQLIQSLPSAYTTNI
jgi:hypothetical protein